MLRARLRLFRMAAGGVSSRASCPGRASHGLPAAFYSSAPKQLLSAARQQQPARRCCQPESRKHQLQGAARRGFSSGSGGGGEGRGLLAWYGGMLERRPLPTKIVTGGLMCVGGDLLCQLGIERRDVFSVDRGRLVRFFIMGSCLTAPWYHVWFGILERRFPRPASLDPRKVSWGTVRRKLAADQGLMALCFNPVFLLCLMALEGHPGDWAPKMQEKGFDMLIANWQLWVPAQIINFALVPISFQVLYMNAISVVWACYLSFVNSSPSQCEVEAEAKAMSEVADDGGGGPSH